MSGDGLHVPSCDSLREFGARFDVIQRIARPLKSAAEIDPSRQSEQIIGIRLRELIKVVPQRGSLLRPTRTVFLDTAERLLRQVGTDVAMNRNITRYLHLRCGNPKSVVQRRTRIVATESPMQESSITPSYISRYRNFKRSGSSLRGILGLD